MKTNMETTPTPPPARVPELLAPLYARRVIEDFDREIAELSRTRDALVGRYGYGPETGSAPTNPRAGGYEDTPPTPLVDPVAPGQGQRPRPLVKQRRLTSAATEGGAAAGAGTTAPGPGRPRLEDEALLAVLPGTFRAADLAKASACNEKTAYTRIYRMRAAGLLENLGAGLWKRVEPAAAT